MLPPLKGGLLQTAIAISMGSCYLLFGYDQGVVGGLVTHPGFLEALGNPSDSYLGTIVAIYNIGCLGGCVAAALFGNKLGRKRTILWGCLIMVIGAIIQASCYGPAQMIVGRIISGIGNGMNTSTIPVYISECSRPSHRGRAAARQLSIVIFGTVVAYWMDFGTISNLTGDVVWRLPIAFQNVFALITIGVIPFIPDTPRWLYSQGRKDESVSVLARLFNCAENDPRIKRTEEEMDNAIRFERESTKFSIKHLIYDTTEAKNTRRLVLCFLLQFFQQFTGINVIAFYVTIVLEVNVGLSKYESSLIAGCIQIAFWLGTIPPMFLLDRVGRRPILMLGSVALLITMVLFTTGIAIGTTSTSRLALAMLFLYEISFGMSWTSVPWLYAPEITPLHLRHVGSAICSFSEWIWTFVIAQMTPPAIANTGWKFYIFFCIMLILSIPFVYFFIPETSGKTLEEIDFIFIKDTPRVLAALDTSIPNSLSSPEDVKIELQHRNTSRLGEV